MIKKSHPKTKETDWGWYLFLILIVFFFIVFFSFHLYAIIDNFSRTYFNTTVIDVINSDKVYIKTEYGIMYSSNEKCFFAKPNDKIELYRTYFGSIYFSRCFL